ncbi:MAG: pimeloyl-ACP methyl ester esterase BioH [Candidatus Methylumidiphilus sp.]
MRHHGVMHTETFGVGPDVVLVHGWSMHSGVWRGFARRLAADFRVTLIDLPGHGRSGMLDDYTLDGVGEALLAAAPERAHWLGWSLGAALSLHVASRSPERLASLTMLAGNARFARAEDWPCAMDLALLAQFAENMVGDYHGTLMKFLGLQTWGLDNAREVLKDLRAHVAECPAPEPAALRAGLEILRGEDLRGALSGLRLPLLILLGGRDRLAPPDAGEAMCALAAGAELQVLAQAAHTPFISHADESASLLIDFWRRHGANIKR